MNSEPTLRRSKRIYAKNNPPEPEVKLEPEVQLRQPNIVSSFYTNRPNYIIGFSFDYEAEIKKNETHNWSRWNGMVEIIPIVELKSGRKGYFWTNSQYNKNNYGRTGILFWNFDSAYPSNLTVEERFNRKATGGVKITLEKTVAEVELEAKTKPKATPTPRAKKVVDPSELRRSSRIASKNEI